MQCNHCHKSSISLKRCGRCHVAQYCNHDCQKAHWKVHKKECARLAGRSAQGGDGSTGSNSNAGRVPPRSDHTPFAAIHYGNFLHNRAEEQTFQLLIDALRLRQEDVFNFDLDRMTGSICSGEASSEGAFRSFLRKAGQIDGFFPTWWNGAKAEECVAYGLRTDHDFSLMRAVKKADVQERWKDNQMPMKLRMLGEKVYGSAPGGESGSSMLELMMAAETGNGGFNFFTMLDSAR